MENIYAELALKEAKKSLRTNDVPVGAVIVQNGKVIAKGHNTKEKKQIVTKHAEINAIEKACRKKKTWYLNDCDIYVTLEPCQMCLNAIKQARIKKVIFLTKQEKKINYKDTELIYLNINEKSKDMLRNFFKNKRK